MPPPIREPTTDDYAVATARAFAGEFAQRRTLRDYADTPVPRELIDHCLRAAGFASSGAGQHPWHFVAVSGAALSRRIHEGAEAEEREFHERRTPVEWLPRCIEPAWPC